MILSFVLMVLFVFVLGVFAAQNSGTHDVVLFNQTWTRVPDWLPVVLSTAAMFLLMLLYAGYARIRHTVGRLTMRRRIDDNQTTISNLRTENDRLRRELGRYQPSETSASSPPHERERMTGGVGPAV